VAVSESRNPQKGLTANVEKHGLGFIAAQALWRDPDRLQIPARSLDEPRAQVIGQIADVLWSAFITMWDDRIRDHLGQAPMVTCDAPLGRAAGHRARIEVIISSELTT
jgi:uncharacterized DUF497 family protein